MDPFALFNAAFNDEAVAVQEAIAGGMDPNATNPKSGLSPLAVASSRGSMNAARALLDAGADPNLKMNWTSRVSGTSWFGRTALMSAATGDMASLLVSRGAKVNDVDEKGWPPIAHAVNLVHFEAFKTLVSLGASLGVALPRDGKTVSLAQLIDEEIESLSQRHQASNNDEIQRMLRDLAGMRSICAQAAGSGATVF